MSPSTAGAASGASGRKRAFPAAFAALLLALAACPVTSAPEPDVALPDAGAVLRQAAQAMGGGWGTHLRRLTVRAIVSSPEGASRVLVDSAYADRLHFEQRYLDGRFFAAWVNGEAAWYLEGNDPRPHALTDTDRSLLRANEWHVICLDLAGRFNGFRTAGRERMAGRDAIRLSMTDELGRPAAAFFDVESFLPLGLELAGVAEGQQVSIRFANWREEDGLRLFRKATVVEAPRVHEYSYTDIDLDRPEGEEFDIPAALERAR